MSLSLAGSSACSGGGDTIEGVREDGPIDAAESPLLTAHDAGNEDDCGAAAAAAPAASHNTLDLNSVVGKVRVIIETLAVTGRMGLSELARTTGVAKPTVHRVCHDLMSWGVVERSGDGFRLGDRLFELGQRVPTRRVLRDVAMPFMEELLQASGHTVHFGVPDGTDVVYLERISLRRGEAVPSEVAGRMPMHCTATGKCMLAFGPAENVETLLASGLQPLTGYSIVDARVLRAELQRTRQRGFAIEREETKVGFMSVAGPVFERPGRLVGAVALTGSVRRLDPSRVGLMVSSATRAISAALAAHHLNARVVDS